MTCGWALLWTLYHNHVHHLGGFNTYLDLKISTLSIRPKEELVEFYSRDLTIHKSNDLYKVVISPHTLMKLYFELLVYCPTTSRFLDTKQVFFTGFLSTHVNHSIYLCVCVTVHQYVHCVQIISWWYYNLGHGTLRT